MSIGHFIKVMNKIIGSAANSVAKVHFTRPSLDFKRVKLMTIDVVFLRTIYKTPK